MSTVISPNIEYSITELEEFFDMGHLEINRRIRRGDIKAHKVGWYWIVKGEDAIAAKNSEWYLKLHPSS